MKRFSLVFLLLAPFAYANGNLNGFCDQGNIKPVVSGLTATNTFLGSYPRCTVTVMVHGGGAATIFSDNSGTPLANPFTASSVGWWQFYAANGRYDVTLSGGTPIALPSSWTIFDQVIFDSTVAGCLGTSLCQGGNSFGTTLTFGTNDSNNINMRINGITRAAYTPSAVTFTADQTAGQTLKLDNTHGTGGASTSVNFYKNGVYVGMVGDRGTSSQMSLQHTSGSEIVLGSGVVSIAGPGGGVLTSGGGLTAGGTPGAGTDGISGGSYAIGAATIIDASQNISVSGSITGNRFQGGYLTTNNTGSLATPSAGSLNWGSVVIAGVTVPVVKDSLGNQTQLGAGGGSGTVTSFSAGNLSPLFTTSVATAATTPALSFSLSSAAAWAFLGNQSNSSLAPGYLTLFSVSTKTNDYTAVCATDFRALLSVSNAGAKTVTLPATPCADGWYLEIENTGAGTWTISRNGNNIDGGTTNPSVTTNGGIKIGSNGSGYFTQRGSAASGSGCASVDPSACILKGSAANSGLNNDAANIALGLLSAHDVLFAANSVEVLRIKGDTNAQAIVNGSTCTSPASGKFCVFAAALPDVIVADSTSGSTNIDWSTSGTLRGVLSATTSNFQVNAVTGDLLFKSAGTLRGQFLGSTGQFLVNEATALSGSTISELTYNAASQVGLFINSSTNTCPGVNADICSQIILGTASSGYTSLNGQSARGALAHPTLLALYGGSGTVTIGSSTTIVHGTSTTTFVSNNGVVFPTCTFGSFPTGAIGHCTCTNCKNSSQDGTVAGATCQSGTHFADAFYNGNTTVCN